jgi:molybdate transport system ATP-binding protein
MSLKLNVNLKYANDFHLNIDSEIKSDAISALFGPSGSGKTSLLRCIAGLEKNAQGTIHFQDEPWQTDHINVETHKRPISYVFQEASLFPHLSVESNLQYAIKRASVALPKAVQNQVLDILNIRDLFERRSDQISGGERQRVAIARAILNAPKLLLLDEPLAALDKKRKQLVLNCIKELHNLLAIPMLYVSHSLEEIAWLADEVLLLNKGSLVSQGSPTGVFSDWTSQNFLDDIAVILEGKIVARQEKWGLHQVNLGDQSLMLPDNGQQKGSAIRLKISANDVSLSIEASQSSSILNRIQVEIAEITKENSASAVVTLKAGGHPLYARLTHKSLHDLGLQIGSRCWAQIKSVAVVQ